MSRRNAIDRRDFLKGAAGVGVASALAACAPGAIPQPAGEIAGAPALKYADKACLHHYMTGGFVGPGPDDNLIKQLQEEALRNEYGLNVDIEFESATWADFDQLLNIRLQTQGTDSLQRDGNRVLNWIATPGLIRDIDAEIKEYGQTLLEMFPQSGYDYFMREDGKYIAIPMMPGTGTNVEYIHIRRDWCDKVDRDIPQTVEELEEVLRLFKENNLGGDFTIPFTCENGSWVSYNVLMGPYVPEPEEQFAMMARGENIERDIGSAMREPRLELLQRWYRDGLLNPEWAIWKSEDVFNAIERGAVGCISGGFWHTNGRLFDIEKEIDPEQDWVQIFPPVGLEGQPHTNRIMSTVAMERGIIVTSWAPCPEAIIALADWENSSWENFLLCSHGIEGKHWQWGEGGWIEDLRSPAPNQEYSGMRHTTPAPQWRSKLQLLPPAPGEEPKDPLINTRIYENHLHNRQQTHVPEQGEYPIITQIDHWTPYMFTESAAYDSDLKALREEYFAKIVKGDLDVVPGVAEFWDRWHAAGGEIRMQEITDQFSTYIQAHPEMEDPHIFSASDVWNTERQYPAPKT